MCLGVAPGSYSVLASPACLTGTSTVAACLHDLASDDYGTGESSVDEAGASALHVVASSRTEVAYCDCESAGYRSQTLVH